MATRRKSGRVLPFGHKATRRGAGRARVRYGPTRQQSVVGTQTSTTPGVFSSAAGGAGFRTLERQRDPGGRVQPSTLGFFHPFAVREMQRASPATAVPFADARAPSAQPTSIVGGAVRASGQRSSIFPALGERSTIFPAL
jgi:hypothetical protein